MKSALFMAIAATALADPVIPPNYGAPYNGSAFGLVSLQGVNTNTGVATYSGSATMLSNESAIPYVTEDVQYVTMYLSLGTNGMMRGTGAATVWHPNGSISTSLSLNQTGWGSSGERVYSGSWYVLSGTGQYAPLLPYWSNGTFSGQAIGSGTPPAAIIFGHEFTGTIRYFTPPVDPPPEQ